MAKVLCVLYDDPTEGYPQTYARDEVRRGCARACAKAQRRVTHGMSADHAHDDHLTEAPGSRRQGVTVASLDLFQGCKYAGGRPDARSDRVATTQPLVGVNGDDLGWRLTRGAAEGG